MGRSLYLGSGKCKDGARAIYVLTHVDVLPNHLDDALTLLKGMSNGAAKDEGNISYHVLQQANPANHLTVLEVWTSKSAFDAHIQAAHTREFRQGLLPMQGALYDERLYDKVD